MSERAVPTASPARAIPGTAETAGLGLLGAALVAQLLLSTVEVHSVTTSVGTVYFAQLMSLLLLLSLPRNDAVLRATARRCVWLAIAFGACAAPAIIAHAPTSRLLPVLQLCMNLVVLLATLGVARRLSGAQLRRAVTVTAVILGTLAAFQSLVMPSEIRGSTARVLGVARPSLLFQEPTWLALTLALLAAAAAQLRAPRTLAGLGLLVVFLWTRAAVLLLGLSLLTRVLPRRIARWSIVVVAATAMLAEASYVLRLIATPFLPAAGESSLVTRIRDVWVVARANGGGFWPWGGDVLRVFDRSRYRALPTTSNVLPFDLIWKFGLGGVALFGFLAIFFFAVSGPVSALARGRGLSEPAGAALLAIPIVGAFNNCLGRSWLWALCGLLIAALAATASVSAPDSVEPHAAATTKRRAD